MHESGIEINKKVFEKFPLIETDRLVLREFSVSDAEDLYILRTDKDVMRYMDMSPFIAAKDAENMILSVLNDYKTGKGISWAIIEKAGNKFVGYFGFWRLIAEHCRGEIGYALNKKFWGKGIMRETMRAMLKFGFKDMGLHSIEANVNPLNIKSIDVLEKCGFQKEAYFRENYLFNGKFLDSAIYSLLEKDLVD